MTATDNILLDIQSLLAGKWPQCQLLLNACYPFNNSENRKVIDRQQLIHILKKYPIDPVQPLIDAVNNRLEAIETIGPETFSIFKFVDQLFNNYCNNSKMHNQINLQIKQFRSAVAISLLNQKLPWDDEINPVTLLSLILQHAVGWQPELGRGAERFLDKLALHIGRLAIVDSKESFSTEVRKLQDFFTAEQQRIKKLEKRLHDAEIGVLHAKHANQLSARTLNQQMAGKKLPASIVAFLQGPWRESMRLLIINEGHNSQSWQHIVKLTETFIWSFQPITKDRCQSVYDSISELPEQLRKVTIGLYHSGNLDIELKLIENEHLKILKGQALEYADFELIDNSDPLATSLVSISHTLLDQATAYNEGQWFLYQSEAGQKRIKLTVKIDRVQQLLFSNFIGVKAEQFSLKSSLIYCHQK